MLVVLQLTMLVTMHVHLHALFMKAHGNSSQSLTLSQVTKYLAIDSEHVFVANFNEHTWDI